MKKFMIIAGVLVLLMIGGMATVMIGEGKIPGALVQTNNIEASVFTAADWQAQQFFLFVGFVLFNLIGISATIAVIVWLFHRGVARARATEPQSE